uniref:Uncharacterized protein n=1 Tax=Romanomermis culicivorax TaxID=13658 RepID=A0A915KEU6_ROMCU
MYVKGMHWSGQPCERIKSENLYMYKAKKQFSHKMPQNFKKIKALSFSACDLMGYCTAVELQWLQHACNLHILCLQYT